MADLKTTYKDDVLNTSANEKRKYNMITNEDGTVSLEDVTDYSQVGDSFGAADINATNEKVNELNTNLTYKIAFPDFTNVLKEFNSYNMSWVASEDCVLLGVIGSRPNTNSSFSAVIYIDDVAIAQSYSNSSDTNSSVFIPVRKGQTIKTHNTYPSALYSVKAYGFTK